MIATTHRHAKPHRPPRPSRRARVVIADPDASRREPLVVALRSEGYRVTEAAWRADLLDFISEPLCDCAPREIPALIVARWELFCAPGGPEILARVLAELEVPLILLATDLQADERSWLLSLGVSDTFEDHSALGSIRAAALRLAPPRGPAIRRLAGFS